MTLAKAVYGDRQTLGATTAVLVAVIALVVLGLSTFIVRPVRALVRQTRAIGAQDASGSRAIARPMVAELAELSVSLEAMAALLEKRAQYIRHFTSSVSHEFKTPLSSIHGAIELLQDASAELEPAQRARFLANIGADAERLSRLVERLMLLARADVATTSAERTDVSALLKQLEQPRVQVVAPAAAAARIPRDALQAAVGHLIENGLKHAGANAQLSVTARREHQAVIIEVADDGPGISPANAERVFEPFFTTARATGGTGLGLSIARALLTAFDGSLELLPAAVRGATFRITVPAA